MAISLGPSVLDTALCIPDLRPRKKESAILELVTRAQRAGVVREPCLLRDALLMRERLGSTAIGKGVATPNARSLGVIEPRILLATSRRGIDWKAEDGLPVQLVFLVISPAEHSLEMHHDLIARAAGFCRLQRNRQRALEAGTVAELSALLGEIAP